MLWRHRFVTDQWGWELPGGIIDEGEDGAKAAVRETEEETGWRPHAVTHLVTYQPMMGMVDAPHEIYLARGAEHVGEPATSDEAGQVACIPIAGTVALSHRQDRRPEDLREDPFQRASSRSTH